MKKIMFLLLLIPLIAYSQSENKENKENKFGIGVGYSFNSVLDSMRPFEIVLKYRLKERHTFYLNMPFQISRKHKDLSNKNYNAEHWKRKSAYGVGCGYDYTIPIYSNLSGFVGVGFEYVHFKNQFHGYIATTDNTSVPSEYRAHWKTYVKKNAYSLLPSVGVRYSIGHWEAEMKYKLYASRIKEYSDDYYIIDEGSGPARPSAIDLEYETSCVGVISLYLTYFF